MSDSKSNVDHPPKRIELSPENYEEVREEEDGTLVLVLSDKAADCLYQGGFRASESPDRIGKRGAE